MAYWGFPRYVPVAEKRAKAQKKLAALQKKNKNIHPVCLQGSTLARSWWGKAWNQNLERYADYSNRIGRGRSYVRQGAVLDLRIAHAEIRSLVQGSRAKPYNVSIKIKPMDSDLWQSIQHTCQGRLGSLSDLLAGTLPKDLEVLFTAKGTGLFPAPKQIAFTCSCPDWASMCKHVAATLYGVGARLDENPLLFFTLRGIDVDSLISEVVAAKSMEMIKKSRKKTSRVMEDSDLSEVFGIEVEEVLGRPPAREKALPQKRQAGKPAKAGTKSAKAGTKSAKAFTPKRVGAGTSPDRGRKTLPEWVAEILDGKEAQSVSQVAAALKKQKGFESRTLNLESQIRVLLYRDERGLFSKVGPGRFTLKKVPERRAGT